MDGSQGFKFVDDILQLARVCGDERRKRVRGCIAAEQLWNRPRPMTYYRSLGHEGERFLPVFDAQPGRGVDVASAVNLQILDASRHAVAQIRRGYPPNAC